MSHRLLLNVTEFPGRQLDFVNYSCQGGYSNTTHKQKHWVIVCHSHSHTYITVVALFLFPLIRISSNSTPSDQFKQPPPPPPPTTTTTTTHSSAMRRRSEHNPVILTSIDVDRSLQSDVPVYGGSLLLLSYLGLRQNTNIDPKQLQNDSFRPILIKNRFLGTPYLHPKSKLLHQ